MSEDDDDDVDLALKWQQFTERWNGAAPPETTPQPKLLAEAVPSSGFDQGPRTFGVAEAFAFGPRYLDALKLHGPYPCAECRSDCELPGICDRCAELAVEKEARLKIERATATIPEQWRWANFKDPETLKSRVKDIDAIRFSMQALRQLMDGTSWLTVLCGDSGRGKTSLGVAMLRCAAEKYPDRTYMFVYAPKIARAYRDSPMGRVPAVIGECERAWMLLIDDLGSDAVYCETLREVIQCREADRKPTIITTFLSEREATEAYGGGIARRLYRDGNAFWVGGNPNRASVPPEGPKKGLVSVG